MREDLEVQENHYWSGWLSAGLAQNAGCVCHVAAGRRGGGTAISMGPWQDLGGTRGSFWACPDCTSQHRGGQSKHCNAREPLPDLRGSRRPAVVILATCVGGPLPLREQ